MLLKFIIQNRFINKWLFSANHKDIGTLYFLFGIFSSFIGVVYLYFIKIELILSGSQFLSVNYALYNSLVTSHGIIMIFFTIMPILLGGFGNWMLPLLIGAPDMAFPRLNNLSFWLLPPALFLFVAPSKFEFGVGANLYYKMFKVWIFRNFSSFLYSFFIIFFQFFISFIFNKWKVFHGNKLPIKHGSYYFGNCFKIHEIIFYFIAIIFAIFEAEILVFLSWFFFYDFNLTKSFFIMFIFFFFMLVIWTICVGWYTIQNIMIYIVTILTYKLSKVIFLSFNVIQFSKKNFLLNIILKSMLRFFLRYMKINFVKWTIYNGRRQVKSAIACIPKVVVVAKKFSYKKIKFKFLAWNRSYKVYYFQKKLFKHYLVVRYKKYNFLTSGLIHRKNFKNLFFWVNKKKSSFSKKIFRNEVIKRLSEQCNNNKNDYDLNSSEQKETVFRKNSNIIKNKYAIEENVSWTEYFKIFIILKKNNNFRAKQFAYFPKLLHLNFFYFFNFFFKKKFKLVYFFLFIFPLADPQIWVKIFYLTTFFLVAFFFISLLGEKYFIFVVKSLYHLQKMPYIIIGAGANALKNIYIFFNNNIIKNIRLFYVSFIKNIIFEFLVKKKNIFANFLLNKKNTYIKKKNFLLNKYLSINESYKNIYQNTDFFKKLSKWMHKLNKFSFSYIIDVNKDIILTYRTLGYLGIDNIKTNTIIVCHENNSLITKLKFFIFYLVNITFIFFLKIIVSSRIRKLGILKKFETKKYSFILDIFFFRLFSYSLISLFDVSILMIKIFLNILKSIVLFFIVSTAKWGYFRKLNTPWSNFAYFSSDIELLENQRIKPLSTLKICYIYLLSKLEKEEWNLAFIHYLILNNKNFDTDSLSSHEDWHPFDLDFREKYFSKELSMFAIFEPKFFYIDEKDNFLLFFNIEFKGFEDIAGTAEKIIKDDYVFNFLYKSFDANFSDEFLKTFMRQALDFSDDRKEVRELMFGSEEDQKISITRHNEFLAEIVRLEEEFEKSMKNENLEKGSENSKSSL